MKERVVLVGLGERVVAPSVPGPSPWTLALATSVVSAATGWAIEELVRPRKKRRRR